MKTIFAGNANSLVIVVFILYQLEMKQRYLVGKMNVPDDDEGSHEEVTMDSLGKDNKNGV